MIVLRNALNYILALVLIICLNFLLPRVAPGDPINAIFGQCACTELSPEEKAELTQRFALDKPLINQFWAYLKALAQGDMGYCFHYDAPVLKVVIGFLPWTLLLVGLSIIFSFVLGIILGIESGWRRGKAVDKVMMGGVMFINGLPDFFIGIVFLLFFGVILNIFPLAGAMTPYAGLSGLALVWDVAKHAFLPVLTLTLVNLTFSYALTRNTMVTTLGEPYILTARAKGLADRIIRYRHAGRNSILPVLTRTGIQVGMLFTGALFVEKIFSYPGMGSLAQEAIETRDYPLIQGILVIVTLFVITSSIIVDLVYKKIDPRIGSS